MTPRRADDRSNRRRSPRQGDSGRSEFADGDFDDPRDESLRIEMRDSSKVAALSFSGAYEAARILARLSELRDWISANGQVVADAVRIERVVSAAAPRGSLLGPEGWTGGSARDAMWPVLLAQTWSTSETGPAAHGASAAAGATHGTEFRSAGGESGRAAGLWSAREGAATALIGSQSAALENWEPTLHLLAQHRSHQTQQGNGELGWAVDQLMAEGADLSGLWAS